MSTTREPTGDEATGQMNPEIEIREAPIQQNGGEATLAQVDERGSDDNNRDNDNNNNENKNKQTTENTTSHKNQKRDNKQKKGTGADSEWGDNMGEKTNEIRVAFQNINGLPKSKDHPKNKDFVEIETKLQIDIMGISEVNLYWPKVAIEDQLQARIREWWQSSHIERAFLKEDGVPSHYQPGGTAMMAIGQISSRVIGSGRDNTGMGRWSWTRFQEKRANGANSSSLPTNEVNWRSDDSPCTTAETYPQPGQRRRPKGGILGRPTTGSGIVDGTRRPPDNWRGF